MAAAKLGFKDDNTMKIQRHVTVGTNKIDIVIVVLIETDDSTCCKASKCYEESLRSKFTYEL